MKNSIKSVWSNPSKAINATLFPLVVSTLVSYAVVNIDQLSDLIRITEYGTFQQLLLTSVGQVYFSLVCWLSARFLLDVGQGSQVKSTDWNLATPRFNSIDEKSYYGGKWGKFLPRIYAIFLPLVIFVHAYNAQYFSLAISSIMVILVVFTFLTFRRNITQTLAGINKRSKLLFKPYFWFVIIGIVSLFTALQAIFDPIESAKDLNGLALIFWGIGSFMYGSIVFVHLLFWPLFNKLMKLIKQDRFCVSRPFPTITILLVPLIISIVVSTDNHSIRYLETTNNKPLQIAPKFKNLDEALSIYQQSPNKRYILEGGKKYIPTFLIASEGGGVRASYWSSVALGILEDKYPDFHQNVFALSGASGGTVGNMFFLAALNAKTNHLSDPSRQCQSELTEVTNVFTHYRCLLKKVAGVDYLSPVTTSFLYNDLLYRFLPLPFWREDRATVLEKSFEKGFADIFNKNTLAKPYHSLYYSADSKAQENAWFPVFIAPTTIQETGQRAIASPFRSIESDFIHTVSMENVFQSQFKEKTTEWQSLENNEFYFPVRLSTAATNSARFPYITPKGSFNPDLNYKEKLHTADAGYFDNYGAIEIEHIINAMAAISSEDEIYVPILLVLKNSAKYVTHDNTVTSNTFDPNQGLDCHSSWPFNEITGPIQTLASVRGSHSTTNLVRLINHPQFAEDQNAKQAGLSASVIVLEYQSESSCNDNNKDDPALGWWISKHSQSQMDRQLVNMTSEDSSKMKVFERLYRDKR
ncbi:hypothetical protein [Thalassotalea montiporae]